MYVYRTYIVRICTYICLIRTYTNDIRTLYEQYTCIYVCVRIFFRVLVYFFNIRTYIEKIYKRIQRLIFYTYAWNRKNIHTYTGIYVHNRICSYMTHLYEHIRTCTTTDADFLTGLPSVSDGGVVQGPRRRGPCPSLIDPRAKGLRPS